MKTCISSISYYRKLGEVVRNIMLCDSSIHSAVCRIVCTTTPSLEVTMLYLFLVYVAFIFYLVPCSSYLTSAFPLILLSLLSLNQQNLYLSRMFDILDIEGLQLAISSGLEVLVSMMSSFSEVCALSKFIFIPICFYYFYFWICVSFFLDVPFFSSCRWSTPFI